MRADAWGVIYLDCNATTPILPEVLEAMLPWLKDGYGNPSGSHALGRRARGAIDVAREQVAGLIGAKPDEVVFTSGGTESVNTALHCFDRLAGSGRAVVSAIEHSAVLRTVESLEREVWLAPVGADGVLDLERFEAGLAGAAFVSVMTANNETGVLQPVAEVARLGRERGLAVHTDAVQAAGKVAIDVRETGVDTLSLSAHKFHGPKGVGALFVRKGLRFEPLLRGGGQERGLRSGTENTAGIVGMGAAAEAARKFLADGGGGRIAEMRDAFEKRVMASLSGVVANGDPAKRLPNTSHLSFDGCDSAGLLVLLDDAGVACSAGSACMAGKSKPSHVQLAMGIPGKRARSSLRVSFSRLNTLAEAEEAAGLVVRAVEKLRSVQGPGVGPVVVYTS
ncbi:MAG: cysteine desulfurase family protein [Verrucomicrobiales bacterium]|nr:cysteine desulfurase family protein [Verrucomicrobiota bacterium JB025]